MAPTKRGSKRKAPPVPMGEGEGGAKPKRVKRKCSVEGCTNRAERGGVCVRHGAAKPKCSAEGCTSQARSGGRCYSHGAERPQCSAEGCTNWARTGGVCRRHGAERKECSAEGCNNQAQEGGVCTRHGAKRKNYECKVEGCSNIAKRRGVCRKHSDEKCAYGGCPNKVESAGLCKTHNRETRQQIVSADSDGGAGGQEGERATKRSRAGSDEGSDSHCRAERQGPIGQGESILQAGHQLARLTQSQPRQRVEQDAPTHDGRCPNGDEEGNLDDFDDGDALMDPPLPALESPFVEDTGRSETNESGAAMAESLRYDFDCQYDYERHNYSYLNAGIGRRGDEDGHESPSIDGASWITNESESQQQEEANVRNLGDIAAGFEDRVAEPEEDADAEGYGGRDDNDVIYNHDDDDAGIGPMQVTTSAERRATFATQEPSSVAPPPTRDSSGDAAAAEEAEATQKVRILRGNLLLVVFWMIASVGWVWHHTTVEKHRAVDEHTMAKDIFGLEEKSFDTSYVSRPSSQAAARMLGEKQSLLLEGGAVSDPKLGEQPGTEVGDFARSTQYAPRAEEQAARACEVAIRQAGEAQAREVAARAAAEARAREVAARQADEARAAAEARQAAEAQAREVADREATEANAREVEAREAAEDQAREVAARAEDEGEEDGDGHVMEQQANGPANFDDEFVGDGADVAAMLNDASKVQLSTVKTNRDDAWGYAEPPTVVQLENSVAGLLTAVIDGFTVDKPVAEGQWDEWRKSQI